MSAPTETPLPSAARRAPTAAPSARLLLAVFTVAVFTSAFLLFLVQPLFSKMVLPLLGGSPAVWNTCMLFFQAALLAGYAWAWATTRWLAPRGQTLAHLALLALAALALPVAVGGAAPAGGAAPVPWLLALMAATVGLPFFALSATGPLLQRWFSHTGHPDAANPYFLYAASNLGSTLALLGYPFLVEPRLRLAEQSGAWTAGYAVLLALVAGCAALLWRSAPSTMAAGAAQPVEEAAGEVRLVTGRVRAWWTLLALVPSSLLLSVTTYITTDISPVPLLWVVPLALYLLTFTVAFSRRPLIPHRWALAIQVPLLVALVISLLMGVATTPTQAIPLHLSVFFFTALVCHGELARLRPPVSHLTEFYLWISVGGVLGGALNVLVAPLLFARMEEYALMLVAACLLRPRRADGGRMEPRLHMALVAVLGLALLFLVRPELVPGPAWMLLALPPALLAVACLGFRNYPARLALCVAAVLAQRVGADLRASDVLLAARSFYGRFTVTVVGAEGQRYHALYHGSTLHGAQARSPARRGEPLTYYLPHGPFGQMMAGLPDRPGRRVGVVGLGTGSSAAYGQPGEEWTFYELDPHMVRVARDTALFTYLADSRARVAVTLGDARLSLRDTPAGRYDLLVLDAFSSDAIPVHLMTREALDLYLSRLTPGGVVAFHISNRYLELEPVLAALARERGLIARLGETREGAKRRFDTAAHWVVLARREEDLGSLARDARWVPAKAEAGVQAWTDDFSNLLSVFDW